MPRLRSISIILSLVPLMAGPLLLATARSDTHTSGSADFPAVSRGEHIYRRACAACHGIAGDGNGAGARYLTPRPRDLTAGTYALRSTPSGTLPTDEDLYRTITYGIPTTMMPAFEDHLSERDRRDVVAYIKRFSDKFAAYPPGEPIEIPDEPEVTPQSIAEGESVYKILSCWMCHGARGDGGGPLSNTLTNDWGRKIEPFDLTSPSYKSGPDHRSLFRTIRTGLNGTPMPSYAGTFGFGGDGLGDLSGYDEVYSPGEISALKSYLASQPTEAQLRYMSDEERAAIATRRTWALVHFVRSLSKEAGLVYRLFVEDTEVTKQDNPK